MLSLFQKKFQSCFQGQIKLLYIEIIQQQFMVQRNHLRKSLFFSLVLIILTQCESLRNPEEVQDAYKVQQHEDVLAKIISDHQVFIYQRDQTEWVLTQEIETGTDVLEVFLTGDFLIIEQEGFYLTLYKRARKVESVGKEYQWRGRIELNREQKVEAVEVKENSLAVRFKQTTDLYDFSLKTWKNERNERMMQSTAPTFQPFVHISTETDEVHGMKLVGDYLLYTGLQSQMKLVKYDGSTFQQVFITTKNSSSAYDVGLDMTKKWLFQGSSGQVSLYADEGSGYQLKYTIPNTYINPIYYMDVYSDYFLACGLNQFPLYKWNGEQFDLEHNFTSPETDIFEGVKMCNDYTIIAPIRYFVDDTYKLALRVYNSSNNYQLAYEIIIEETYTRYTLVATDDCATVVLSSVLSYPAGNKVYVFQRNIRGHFEMLNAYQRSRTTIPYTPCIHPDGNFFIVPTSEGSDLWVWDQESLQYSEHSVVGSSETFYISCAINRELIVLADNQENVAFSVYNPRAETEDPPESGEYGRKIEVQISEPQLLPETRRKPIDVAFAGDYLVVADQYRSSSAYTQESGSFSLSHALDQGKFLTSLDYEDSLQLLVQGSYDRTAYVYKDSGSGLASVKNISTESQIMAVDLDADGRLLLGHMNGDISEYSWNSSEFNAANKFPTAGGRIYGVKSCPNQEIVALKEKEGRFHLVLMGASGDEKYNYQLEELVVVKFAVSEDCSKVFISSTMQMQVQVFVLEEGQYSLFRTVQEKFPLYDIAIHPEADMFVVSRHTNHSSAVYRYDQCAEDYELEEVIVGGSDHYAVEMTDDRVVLAELDGTVTVYNYTYSLREVCTMFGHKEVTIPLADVTTAAATRPITNMDVSSNLVVASSLYSAVLLVQITEDEGISVRTFHGNTFVSSVSIISALQTFAVGTFNKSVLVYIDSGSGYELNQTIQTDSQVTAIDLRQDNKLLVGMMNGDLAEYSSDGSSFSSTVNTSNTNSQVYAVKLCPGGTKVALLEAAGVFSLTIFPADAAESVSFAEELQDEFIEPYLSVSSNCQIIAVSGVSMQKVQVFRKATDYQLFKSIAAESPLSKVSVEEDGDILVVPSIISPESYVYHYHQCTEAYSLIKTLDSGTYDESTAINNQFILQGNLDGTIKISEYSSIYNATCESIDSSTTVRDKSSSNSETENSEGTEDDSKKLLTTDSKNQDELSSEGSAMTPGILFLIGLGSVIVLAIFVTFIRWLWQKEPHHEESQEKATAESAKEMSSHQTF